MISDLVHLGEIAKKSADLFGSKIAFYCEEQRISFDTLNKKSNQLANGLIKNGLKKGDRVGILLERSIQSVIAVYGILKAGGVFVPLNPSAPDARIASIIDDCDIEILISSDKKRKNLSNIMEVTSKIRWVFGSSLLETPIGSSFDELDSFDSDQPEVMLFPEDNAYIIFTSGTTGEPKGIVHTHRSGLSYARLSSELYDLSPNDCIGLVAALPFDQSTFGYFSAPLSGSSTVLFGDMELMMPGTIANIIIERAITILYSVPQFYLQLLSNGFMSKFHSLKWILYGGETFKTKFISQILDQLPAVIISNVYGPAEVNQCTYFNISKNTTLENQVPLGKAWAETDLKIIGDEGQEIESGQGELLVHSSTMMKGYWNKTVLTSQRLLLDSKSNKRYYKTGDIVRLDDKGQLFFVGRKDHQVKIRGFRVELEEIQHELDNLSEIENCAVLPINSDEGLFLLAVYTLNDSLSNREIERHLKRRLPKYSIPKYLIQLDELPTTKNGKVDRDMILKRFNEQSLQTEYK